MRTGWDQSTDDDGVTFTALLLGFKPQPWDPGLPPYLTPVARTPGSTGPQMTMAGWLGTARKGAVFIVARAAAHYPPDGAQATGGGTLWATGTVSPAAPHLPEPQTYCTFICKTDSSTHLPRKL